MCVYMKITQMILAWMMALLMAQIAALERGEKHDWY